MSSQSRSKLCASRARSSRLARVLFSGSRSSTTPLHSLPQGGLLALPPAGTKWVDDLAATVCGLVAPRGVRPWDAPPNPPFLVKGMVHNSQDFVAVSRA